MKFPTLLNRKKFKLNYCLLGFLIPFLGMGLAILIRAISGHSENPNLVFSMLNSDAYHQYFPFFKAFREDLRSGGSLLFTWDVGMGMDYLGIISYYLGSPLNLLSVIIPDSWLVDYFTLLNPIRVGLAGLFFSLMLQKLFDKNDFSIALFGSFYATCAWVIGYMWNSMWMDTFALLPLVVLGTVSLLNQRKFLLYTVSLFLSVAINYYIGFFTCIFTLFVFICYEICRFRSIKKFFMDLLLMGIFTVIAIGMTAFISLPAYMQLMTTSSSGSELPAVFDLNKYLPDSATAKELEQGVADFLSGIMDPESEAYDSWYDFLSNASVLFEGMKQSATNTFVLSEANLAASEGLPNIYCGSFTALFIFLFFLSKPIRKRDRICTIIMLLFFNASFMIRQLDYIWHGFHFPNMIPYRFSFLYSFVLLFAAYRIWLIRRRLRVWQVLTATGLSIGMLLLSNATATLFEHLETHSLGGLISAVSSGSVQTMEVLPPFVNLLLLLLYSGGLLLCAIRKPLPNKLKRKRKLRVQWYNSLKHRRRLASIFLMSVIGLELVIHLAYFSVSMTVVNLSAYPRGLEDTERIIQIMKEREEDNLFYRAETTHTQTFNDGALNGYNGITTFCSASDASVTTFMKNLGYGAEKGWNRYAFEEGSPVSNLFLNIKYMIERQGKLKNNPYFTDIHHSGKVHLLENNYYLPLGFLTDPALAELPFNTNGINFGFQDKLLSAALGTDVTAWTVLGEEGVSISSTENVTVSNISHTTGNCCNYKANANGGSVFYTYTFQQEGLLCLRFSFTKRNNITLSYDDGSGYKTLFTEDYSLPATYSVCQVKPGDRIQVTLKCKANESGQLRLAAAILDEYVIRDAHAELSQSTLNLTTFEDTFIEGTIDCHKDGLLYTSIPNCNGNWQVYVDGEPAEVSLIGEAMTGVMLTEGQHTVAFKYKNTAFKLGCVISSICTLSLIAISWYTMYFKKKHPDEKLISFVKQKIKKKPSQEDAPAE